MVRINISRTRKCSQAMVAAGEHIRSCFVGFLKKKSNIKSRFESFKILKVKLARLNL